MKLLDILFEEMTINGSRVWNHIVNITPEEDMIPNYFKKFIVGRQFNHTTNFDVSSLLQTDPDFKEYYDSEHNRYEDDEDIDPNDLNEPIVVVDGELLDGYSRATNILRYGTGVTDAYVAVGNKSKSDALKEDLRKWFKEKWVNIGKKVDGKHPPCGTSGKKKGYAKCVPAAKAAKMSKKEKESATKRKRKAQNTAGRGGKDSSGQGKTPIYVSTKAKNEQMTLEEKLNLFLERNCPNDPGKWSASKAAAKSKFDVYPSAYANGWAAKNYKSKGGTWRKCNEGMDPLCEEEISPENERDMIEGIAEIVRGVKDINNRKELAKKQIKQLKSEGIKLDVKEFLSLCGFKSKIEEEEIDEYDVETIQEFQDFKQFIREYTTIVNEAEGITEAEYRGRKVQLGKPMQGDVKKFKVYVKNSAGKVVKVNFGQKGMVIKKNNPKRRKSFRARMNCDNPGPRWKANYWSCRKW